MPHANRDNTGNVLNSLSNDVNTKKNIIHEMMLVGGMPTHEVESMSYCVTFLDKYAQPLLNHSHDWISGKAMNDIITHQNKKKKFIFDDTVIFKQGWILGDVENQAGEEGEC